VERCDTPQKRGAAPEWGKRAPGGLIPPWRLTASGWCPCGWAHGPRSRPGPGGKMPTIVCEQGSCRRFLPRPWPAMRRPAGRCAVVGILPPGGGVVRCYAGAKGRAYGPVKQSYNGGRGDGVEGRAVQGTAPLAHGLYLWGDKQRPTRVGERHHGTSRLRTQRHVRKPWAFANARRYHGGMRWLAVGRSNFCWPHSRLHIKLAAQVTQRSPARAAGGADPQWSPRAWLRRSVLRGQRSSQDTTHQ
jgi:hypothetical protein